MSIFMDMLRGVNGKTEKLLVERDGYLYEEEWEADEDEHTYLNHWSAEGSTFADKKYQFEYEAAKRMDRKYRKSHIYDISDKCWVSRKSPRGKRILKEQ